MLKHRFFFAGLLFFFYTAATAQQNQAVLDYINDYKELAMQEMIRTGVPASIKLAQGIHETDAGNSVLVKKSNNHFGIKCKSNWTGMKVRHTDDAPHECFRKYSSPEDSYRDHSDFLKTSQRYASLFTLNPEDYEKWAWGLKKAGYATNPKYPQILIRLVEEYNLQEYSLIAMGKMKREDESLAKNNSETEESEIAVSVIPAVLIEKPLIMEPEEEVVVSAKRTSANEIKQEIPAKPLYPDGEFKINETRVIYAKSGTPYLSIAIQYNVPLARIFEFNDMKPDEFVSKDQLIYLMRKRKTGLNVMHTVQAGETIHDIAQTQALRIESLIEYNALVKGKNPVPGTILHLRQKAVNPISSSAK